MEERIMREKATLRAQLLERIQRMSAAYIDRSNRSIYDHLLALRAWNDARTVFLYISVGREADTRALLHAALAAGKTVALPRTLGGGRMEARIITSTGGLKAGAMGIPEPGPESALLPADAVDLVVVPCMAADRQGYRLGHGGGYYDRYLASASGTSVCLCRERLLLDALPRGALDRRVDAVLSECGLVYGRALAAADA